MRTRLEWTLFTLEFGCDGGFMNSKRRSVLRAAIKLINRASDMVSVALEEEEESIYNLPENLQMGKRHEAMENAVDYLGDAISSLDDARGYIDSAMS